MSDRVSFLIDGFNVYHSVDDALKQKRISNGKWLDYMSFCQSLLNDVVDFRSKSTIAEVHYFTAYKTYSANTDSVGRHRKYVAALKSSGVLVTLGNFKKKRQFCRLCHKEFVGHEEKETDVNIAVGLMRQFIKNTCDVAVIMTGDTDLVAAVVAAKELWPSKRIGVALPFNRGNRHFDKVADFTFQISAKSYQNHQFPDPLVVSGMSMPKPLTW